MKKSIFTFFLACTLILSCSEQKTSSISSEKLRASGEFLFEGPNTLTGDLKISTDNLSEQLSVNVENIHQVKVKGVNLEVLPDSLSSAIESVLVQVVSNQNSLETVGTKSPWQSEDGIFNLNNELDLLPYLKDSGNQLVVDVNINRDLDELNVNVMFDIEITYTK